MSRSGLVVTAAAVVVAVVVGVYAYLNFFQQGTGTQVSPIVSNVDPGVSAPSEEQLMAAISQGAVGGGFAATFSEVDVAQWRVSEGHRLERFQLGGGGTILARLSSSNPLQPPVQLDGIFIEVPKEFADRANGKIVEVGVVARASKTNPASSFAVVYFTRKVGNSGWLKFPLSGEFELKKFEFEVPAAEDGYPFGPAIAMYGDPEGGNKGVELLGMYVKVKQ